MKYMSRPKSTAVKDIDITDILGQKYRYHIVITKGDIDPPLVCSACGFNKNVTYSSLSYYAVYIHYLSQ